MPLNWGLTTNWRYWVMGSGHCRQQCFPKHPEKGSSESFVQWSYNLLVSGFFFYSKIFLCRSLPSLLPPVLWFIPHHSAQTPSAPHLDSDSLSSLVFHSPPSQGALLFSAFIMTCGSTLEIFNLFWVMGNLLKNLIKLWILCRSVCNVSRLIFLKPTRGSQLGRPC